MERELQIRALTPVVASLLRPGDTDLWDRAADWQADCEQVAA